MKKEIILKALKRFKKHAEDQGLNVFAVALKGSQNYNLDDAESDIDANIVFIPTLQQLRANKAYKFTFEEGEVVCHNIYSFASIVAKGNPQWIEVCNTEYIIGDLTMFKHFKINPSSLKGMIMDKFKGFSKMYPSRKKVVEEYGYDPKQLHHIIRLYDLLLKDSPVHKYYGIDRDIMLKIKRGFYTKQEAEAVKDEYMEELDKIYEKRKLQYTPQMIDFDAIDKIMVKSLVKDFGLNSNIKKGEQNEGNGRS